jgi:hypothetical protein
MPAMRSVLLSLLFALVALAFLSPRTAEASAAPFYEALEKARGADSPFGLAPGERGDAERGERLPRGPVEDPADWIAVVGIACYAIIPVVLVVVLGFVAYRVYLNNTDAALLSADSGWAMRGSRPPQGLVLLRF